MQNNKIGIVALVLAIGALGLGVYNYILSAPASDSGDFHSNVMAVIDDYVEEQRQKATSPQAAEPVEGDISDNDPREGDPKAPVVLVEFSDYECPFCGKFFNETLPQIRKNYIDTGKVLHVFRDFPLSFHPTAMPAAIAAECVHDQTDDETYFKYHDLLYANQQNLTDDKLRELAGQLDGVNVEKLGKCMDDKKFADEVAADMKDGQKYGVNGTPGFFINGRPISGAQPYAVFEKMIEEELAK